MSVHHHQMLLSCTLGVQASTASHVCASVKAATRLSGENYAMNHVPLADVPNSSYALAPPQHPFLIPDKA